MWILKTESEYQPPFSFRILPGNIKTLGRSTGAEFIVDANRVSRLHCQLSAGATHLEVVDLDSTNGTFVNGQRISRATLKDGDTLAIGRVELTVSLTKALHS
jgi:pSer/pThr/pTyr-binding forkhead associated (FHA) protein